MFYLLSSIHRMVRGAAWHAAMLVLLIAAVADAESRFANVHMATGRHGELMFVHDRGFEEMNGVFVSDADARHLRFEAAGAALFDVPFERLIAMHCEESSYPPHGWFHRAGRYFVVH